MRLEDLDGEQDGRRRAPSATRNRSEILPVLAEVLGDARTVLEIASGTGQHAVFFAEQLPTLIWQPTDRDAQALDSIRAWRAQAALPNLSEPRQLDVEDPDWRIDGVDAVVAINFLHITTWSACRALIAGAGRVLADDGVLVVYGAMFRDGREPEPSNLEFDARLRARSPDYGVRRLEDLTSTAREFALDLGQVVDMPNHNVIAVFRRAGATNDAGEA